MSSSTLPSSIHPTGSRRLAGLALLAALALATTACSVTVDDDPSGDAGGRPGITVDENGVTVDDGDGTSASVTQDGVSVTSGDTDVSVDGDGVDVTTGGASPDTSAGLAPGALPADLVDLALNEVTCGGGELEVDAFAAAVRVVDGCGTLVVTGSSAVVVAGDVGTLVVDAFSARVHVDTAGSIDLGADSSGATVTWGSGTPSVTDGGWENAVHQAKE